MVERLVNSEVNARRIANIEACFGSSGNTLAIYGRVLVGEGVLVKMCRKKPKHRQFFLFNDVLVYGTILISKKRYSKQHIIPLEEVQLQNLDDGDSHHGWIIKTRTKSFAVFAASESEKREWMLHIERCVHDILQNSGKTASTEHAAVWIPDNEAAKCMNCQKTQFNVLQRRHHCRACGNVVCSSCSAHNYRISCLSKRPVRVCDTCYEKYMSIKTIGTNGSAIESSDSDDDEKNVSFNQQATFYSQNL